MIPVSASSPPEPPLSSEEGPLTPASTSVGIGGVVVVLMLVLGSVEDGGVVVVVIDVLGSVEVGGVVVVVVLGIVEVGGVVVVVIDVLGSVEVGGVVEGGGRVPSASAGACSTALPPWGEVVAPAVKPDPRPNPATKTPEASNIEKNTRFMFFLYGRRRSGEATEG